MSELNRKVFLLGFGAVGLAFLELSRRAGLTRDFEFFVVSEDFVDPSALSQGDIQVVHLKFTKSNLEATLTKLVPPGSLIVNCLAAVATIDLLRFAAAHWCFYIDTSVENWEGEEAETHERQAAIFANRGAFREGPPLIINHGMNPGLVSHFVKEALESEWAERGQPGRRDWSRMARELGVVGVHVSELDDQSAAFAPDPGDFYSSWSIESFQCESLESSVHALGSEEPTAHGSVITLPDGFPALVMPSTGMRTLAASYTPSRGRYFGYVMSHVETFTIAALLSERGAGGTIDYRPSVLFCYRPCPLAVWSLQGERWDQRSNRLLLTEIDDGSEEIGVTLIRGPNDPLIWYGSTLTDRESRLLSPRSNATSVQVAAGLYAGFLAGLSSRQGGLLEPEDMDHRSVLEYARPFLGGLRKEFGPAGAIDPHFVFSVPEGTVPPLLDHARDRPRSRNQPAAKPRGRTPPPILSALDPMATRVCYDQWMAEHGSPLLVYSENALRQLSEGFRTFTTQMRRPARIAYAVKACPAPAVLGVMRTAGFDAEVNSLAEYRRARAAGFAPSSILVSGVAKDSAFIEAALGERCHRIQIDSVEEIMPIAERARALGRRQDVYLRLCPRLVAGRSSQLETGAADSKFGILSEDIPRALTALRTTDDVLRLVGLHVHSGSGGELANVYDALIDVIADATRCIDEEGFSVSEVNLGGGFVSAPARPTQVAGAARILSAIDRLPTHMAVTFEPGRFLVEHAASIFCRVAGVKWKGGERWVLLDCGYAHMADIAILGESYPVQAYVDASDMAEVRLGGPLCDSADVMRSPDGGPFVAPSRLGVGDIVEIGAAGAYVYGTGSNFCGTMQPAVLLLDSAGKARVVRRAETLSDIGRCEYA